MKVCRHCGQPDQTAQKRGYTILCAECHLDMVRGQNAPVEAQEAPETLVWTPRETGVLKYNPFRLQGQGGGR